MKSLKAPTVDEFRNVSKLFRSGLCNARAYYEHCEAVLGERFESIFPELLALLPDINKQQVTELALFWIVQILWERNFFIYHLTGTVPNISWETQSIERFE